MDSDGQAVQGVQLEGSPRDVRQNPSARWFPIAKECKSSYDGAEVSLFFREGSLQFSPCEWKIVELLETGQPDRGDGADSVARNLIEQSTMCSDQGMDLENAKALVCFRAALGSEELSTMPYQRVQIRLVGHANEAKPGRDRFPSNYELSEARVQSVHMLLSGQARRFTGLGKAEIQWLHVAQSSEPRPVMVEGSTRVLPNEVDPRRSVDVLVEGIADQLTAKHAEILLPPASLDPLDYLYFMIYTITTTGYGDMRPVTPLAKFICSVANLFEVLFLVILFNVFVGARRSEAIGGAAGVAGDAGTGG
jgi:hypothetical protein